MGVNLNFVQKTLINHVKEGELTNVLAGTVVPALTLAENADRERRLTVIGTGDRYNTYQYLPYKFGSTLSQN